MVYRYLSAILLKFIHLAQLLSKILEEARVRFFLDTLFDRYLITSYCTMGSRGVSGITRRPALPRSPLHYSDGHDRRR